MAETASLDNRMKTDALIATINIIKLNLEIKYGPSVKESWQKKREKTNQEYDLEIPESA